MKSRHLVGFIGGVLLLLVLGWNDDSWRGGNSLLLSQANPAMHSPVGEPASASGVQVPGPEQHTAELLNLAADFQALRRIDRGSSTPNYAEQAARQARELPNLRKRLEALTPDSWPVHQKVDYLLLRSEMDDLDFTLRVWRPTTRNPKFYTSAALGNVNRHHTGGRYFRGDPMPYSRERAQAILAALAQTGPILEQGKSNLTELVPELADLAIRYPFGAYYDKENSLENIVANYENWARRTAEHFPQPEASQLVPAATAAGQELQVFGEWLQQNRDKGTGKVAIGMKALDWYMRHVMLMPYDHEDLRLMAELERARVVSFMQFEMQKNRHLPKIKPAETRKQFLDWDTETAMILRRWYRDDEQILSDPEYIRDIDVRSENGEYIFPFGLLSFTTEAKPDVSRVLVPPPDHPNAERGISYFGFYTDPGTIHGHEYWPGHWYQREQHGRLACPIRRSHRDGAHSQGWCFYHEEMPVQLGFPFVRGARAHELVYMAALHRSVRILVGMDVLAGRLNPDQGFELFNDQVPAVGSWLGVVPEIAYREIAGVMERGIDYATTGKLQIFKLLADRKMQLKDDFDLREFHDQVTGLGSIPFTLLRWEMTGLDDEVRQLWTTEPLRPEK